MSVSASVAVDTELMPGNWTTLIENTRGTTPIQIRRGINGSSPIDRVASTGIMSFAMDNTGAHAGPVQGYYSPDNAAVLKDWDIGKKIRLKITHGGTTYEKYHGKIDTIGPQSGKYLAPLVDVGAVDYMDELASHNLGLIAAQTNVRGDQLLAAVVANMPNAPEATSYDTGSDVYAHGLHSEKDETTKGLSAAQKIALSGMDDIFVTGDGTLVYRSRQARILNASVAATFQDTMKGLKVRRTRDSIYNNISVSTHPFERDTSPVILYSHPGEISLGPGASTTFTARYTDPLSSGRRVSSDQMITPAANTDYKMAHRSGGKGNSLNAYLTVETFDESGVAGTFGSNSSQVKLTNTHTTKTGFIGRFNLRGYGLYEYDRAPLTHVDAASQALYGDRPLRYDLPYQQDVHIGEDFLNFFKAHYLAPVTAIESLEFVANNSNALMLAALTLDVGSRIAVTETVTGIDTEYFVNGYALRIDMVGLITCTLGPLARADLGGPFGQIGHSTYGKIGTTFKVGY